MAWAFGSGALFRIARKTDDRAFLAACALLFVAGVAATISWCGSMPGGMAMPGGWTMSMAWMRMPAQSWPGAAASFLGMWIVMTVAMMLPSLQAMLSSYRRSLRGPDETRRNGLTALAGAGYFFVWTLMGVAVYPLGVALGAAEMRWLALARSVPLATGLIFLFAGCVQLTGWKVRQLGCCRDLPAGGESASSASAWRHGLYLGVKCSLSSAPWMGILLVSDVMDLGAMALVTVAITAERLSPKPERTARAAGVVILAAGALAIVRAVRAA